MPAPAKQPTWTHLVEEALRVADDFLPTVRLRELTGANVHQLSAALHHLQKRKVIDAVSVQGGPYWFYLGQDTRTFSYEERTPETKPRRARRGQRGELPK